MTDWVARDLRYAVRNLARTPGFTSLTVVVLALLIGANTAVFSIVNAVLLRSFPFEDPSQLVVLWEQRLETDTPFIEVSFRNAMDWRQRSGAFEELAVFGSNNWSHEWRPNGGEAQILKYSAVSTSFFRTMGATPLLGRDFLPGEDESGAERVVILSDGFWKKHLGGDPNAVGETIVLSEHSFTVVGIMSPEFQFPEGVDFWSPAGRELADVFKKHDISGNEERWFGVMYALGRLKDGVSPRQAKEELDTIASSIADTHDPSMRGRTVAIKPFLDYLLGTNTRKALRVLWAAVGLLLLIGCANLGSLLLVRAVSRQKEIAVRFALGGGRFAIVRQLMTESLVLVLAGGVGGVLVALWGLWILPALSPVEIPRMSQAGIDGRVLSFALGLSLLTAVLVGLAPALSATRHITSNSPLYKVGRGVSEGRETQSLRHIFVVAEITLAVLLLVGAGLTLESFRRLTTFDLGFRTARVLTFKASPSSDVTPEEKRSIAERLLERIASVPGVVAAAAISNRPFEFGPVGWDVTFVVEGQPLHWRQVELERDGEVRSYTVPEGEDFRRNPLANGEAVTPDYFRAMGIPILRGRGFTQQDNEQARRVVIVNESFAEGMWPGEDPIGKGLLSMDWQWDENQRPIYKRVVGVVKDVRYRGIEEPRLDLYFPFRQSTLPTGHFVVLTAQEPLALARAIGAEVESVDPDIPITGLTTLQRIVERQFAPWRFNTFLFGVFGLSALSLAALGTFGVLAYSVSRRTNEIGVRMALGANKASILRLVLGAGMRLVAMGLALGLGLAFLTSRLIAGLLFGVSSTDPVTYTSVSIVFVIVAVVACYLPARRASSLDPSTALRHE